MLCYDEKQRQSDNDDNSSTNSHNNALSVKTIEENYQRFNELIQQNLLIENNLEKELAAGDKKCTFLKHKIQYIKKQKTEADRISSNQEKRVHAQRMEIEKIRSAISEQTEKLKTKFPDDGLTYYSNMVTVISNMIEYVDNFKIKLNDISMECKHVDTEIKLQEDVLNELIDRLYKMMDEKKVLHEKYKELMQLYTPYDFYSMNQNLVSLHEKFNEYLKLKDDITTANIVKENLEAMKKENIDKFQKTKQKNSEMLKKYDNIITFYGENFNELRTVGINIENEYYKMVMEWDMMMINLFKQIKTLKNRLCCDKQNLEALTSEELKFRNEYHEICLLVEHLNAKDSKSNTLMDSLKEQEPFSMKIKCTLEQQINTDEQTKQIYALELDKLMQEVECLKINHDTFSFKSKDPIQDYEKLLQIITVEQDKIQNMQSDKQKLENDIDELKQSIEKLSLDELEPLKNDLTVRLTERNFLQLALKNMQEEVNNTVKKEIEKINQNLIDTMEDVNELSNSTFEKKLIIDDLLDDIQENTKEYVSFQYNVWSANQEYENKKIQLENIMQDIIKEEEACKNKKKLLEDLQKNTFPRNKIPANWFKSFEKQKKEYEILAKDRLELEKQRNKLIIEIDSEEGFQKNKSDMSVELTSEESSKVNFNKEIKTALYDKFKQRISKRDSLM